MEKSNLLFLKSQLRQQKKNLVNYKKKVDTLETKSLKKKYQARYWGTLADIEKIEEQLGFCSKQTKKLLKKKEKR